MMKNFRMVSLSALALALFVVSASAFAAEEAIEAIHDGQLVSITSSKLVMTNKDGKEHSHAVSADTTVSCDGKVCKSSDLKPGMKIRVTLESNSPHAATRIEAIEKNLDFASL